MSNGNAPNQAPQPTRKYMRQIEENAMQIRRQAQVNDIERLDPRMCADKLDLRFVELEAIEKLSPTILEVLMSVDARKWSGISKKLPNGKLLLALNPNMTPERANVTMMEEVAHAHYGHDFVQLCSLADDIYQRVYDSGVEREAYWTAAAALLPAKAVAMAVYRSETADDLAVRYNVSPELAEMRIKTLGLWSYVNPSPVLRRAT
jgi:Zn-dependent peptidase ImmA (M78 family)